MGKRKILFTSLATLALCSVGCNNENNSTDNGSNPTFQTDTRIMPVREENASVIQLSYEEVESKIIKKESFILLIKQEGCLSCKAFAPIIEQYVNNSKINVYSIETLDIPKVGSKLYYSYTPTLQIFKNGEMIDSKDPVNAETKMFTVLADLEEYLNKYVIVNNLLYISDTSLDSKITNKESFIVYFGWKSCGDCQMMSKMFLDEYLYNTKDLNQPLYALEVDPWRSQKASNPEVWEAFTAKYHLSKTSDEVFGYRTGVVPTIQYYENGILSDVVVYFNDVLTTVTNDNGDVTGYKIDFDAVDGVFSYYPEEIRSAFGETVFSDYQAYKDETNDFYKGKLLDLFNKVYK